MLGSFSLVRQRVGWQRSWLYWSPDSAVSFSDSPQVPGRGLAGVRGSPRGRLASQASRISMLVS